MKAFKLDQTPYTLPELVDNEVSLAAVLIVVGKIKDIRHSPVGVGCSDRPISQFMLMCAVLSRGRGGSL